MNLPSIQFSIGTSEVRLEVKPILINNQSYDSIQFGSKTIALVQIRVQDDAQELTTTIPFWQHYNQMWKPFVYASHGVSLRPLHFRTMNPGDLFVEYQDFIKEPLASPWSQQSQFLGKLDSISESTIQSLGTLINLIISAFLLASDAWESRHFIYHSNEYFEAVILAQIKAKCEALGLGLNLKPYPDDPTGHPGFRPRYEYHLENPKYLNWILMTHGVLFPHYREVSRQTPVDARFMQIHRLIQNLSELIVTNIGASSPKSARGLFQEIKYYKLTAFPIRECFSGTEVRIYSRA